MKNKKYYQVALVLFAVILIGFKLSGQQMVSNIDDRNLNGDPQLFSVDGDHITFSGKEFGFQISGIYEIDTSSLSVHSNIDWANVGNGHSVYSKVFRIKDDLFYCVAKTQGSSLSIYKIEKGSNEPEFTVGFSTLSLQSDFEIVLYKEHLYFSLYDPLLGGQSSLWKTDGTQENTKILQNFPGSRNFANRFVINNDLLYFRIAEGNRNEQLTWMVTNGEEVRELDELEDPYNTVNPPLVTSEGIYFLDPGVNKWAYRVNGYSVRPFSLLPATSGVNIKWIDTLNNKLVLSTNRKAKNGKLFLASRDFKEIQPMPVTPDSTFDYLFRIYSSGQKLFIIARDEQEYGIWVADESNKEGKFVFPVPAGATLLFNEAFIHRSEFYFILETPDEKTALWKTDGTNNGTILIRSFDGDYSRTSLTHHLNFGTRSYFSVNTDKYGNELWSTNGTVSGTFLVEDLNPYNLGTSPIPRKVENDELFFVAMIQKDQDIVNDLYVTNGEESKTYSLFHSQDELIEGILQTTIFPFKDKIYFIKQDDLYGAELHYTTRDSGECNVFIDLGVPGQSSYPSRFTEFEDKLYFIYTDHPQSHNGHLAYTEGDSGQVSTVISGIFQNGIVQPVVFEDHIYFTANTLGGTHLLLKTNGKAGHVDTLLSLKGNGFNVIASNSRRMFFQFQEYQNLPSLYYSDGTMDGTIKIKELVQSSAGTNLMPNIALGDSLIYFGLGEINVYNELWISDGSLQGTKRVVKFEKSSSSPPCKIRSIFLNKSEIYLAIDNGEQGELWVSDGTQNGTRLIKEIDILIGRPEQTFAAIDQQVFFAANDGQNGYELWSTDGTPENTQLFADVNPGPSSSNPQYFTIMDQTLFFTADDGLNGTELWKTNGVRTSIENVGSDKQKEINWTVFPNPGHQEINVKMDEAFSSNERVQINLINIGGSRTPLYDGHYQPLIKLERTHQVPGAYWIEIAIGKKVDRKLLILQ